MKNFEALVTSHGLSAILDHIHAIVILAEKDGSLLSWNRAFDRYKAVFPADGKIEDLFLDKTEMQSRILLKKMERWVTHIFPSQVQDGLLCDCMILPLEKGQILFVAEIINSAPKLLNKVDSLSKELEVFKNESETAKKLAKRKEVEVNGIMAQATEISQVDSLTLLPNRRRILRELQDEVLRAQRYNTPFTISIVDVDHFKKINDTYGHLAGDEVLKNVGEMLSEQIRHPDLAGRYGGEEFIILLPNSNTRAAAEQASRLCKFIREAVIQIPKHVLQITVSIGIAELKPEGDTWEALINRADSAMYEAKSAGRDRWIAAQ
jgi:diguanylate cyclase (GGDEF)-like protein